MNRYKVDSPRVLAFRNTQQGSLWAVVVAGRLDSTVIEQSTNRLQYHELMLARYRVAFEDRRQPDGTYRVGGSPEAFTEEQIKANILKYRMKLINHAQSVLDECAEEARATDRLYCWSKTRRIAKQRARRAAKLYRNVEVIPTIKLPRGFQS